MNVIISSSTSGMVMMLRVLIAHTSAFVRSDFDRFLTRKLVYSSDAAAIKAAKINSANFQRGWLYWEGFIDGAVATNFRRRTHGPADGGKKGPQAARGRRPCDKFI